MLIVHMPLVTSPHPTPTAAAGLPGILIRVGLFAGLALLSGGASAEATMRAWSPTCQVDPVSRVRTFDTTDVPDEKFLLDYARKNCVGELDEIAEAGQRIWNSEWSADALMQPGIDFADKAIELTSTLAEVAAGWELYTAKCVGWSFLEQLSPLGKQTAYTASQNYEIGAKIKKELDGASDFLHDLNRHQARNRTRVNRGLEPLPFNHADYIETAKRLAKLAKDTKNAAQASYTVWNDIVSALQNASNFPQFNVPRSHDARLRSEAALKACDFRVANTELQSAMEFASKELAFRRYENARMGKRLRELSLSGADSRSSARYQEYQQVRNRERRSYVEQQQAEARLNQLGEQCSALKKSFSEAETAGARLRSSLRDAGKLIDACDLDAAQAALDALKNEQENCPDDAGPHDIPELLAKLDKAREQECKEDEEPLVQYLPGVEYKLYAYFADKGSFGKKCERESNPYRGTAEYVEQTKERMTKNAAARCENGFAPACEGYEFVVKLASDDEPPLTLCKRVDFYYRHEPPKNRPHCWGGGSPAWDFAVPLICQQLIDGLKDRCDRDKAYREARGWTFDPKQSQPCRQAAAYECTSTEPGAEPPGPGGPKNCPKG